MLQCIYLIFCRTDWTLECIHFILLIIILLLILLILYLIGQVNGAMRLARDGVNSISYSSGRVQLYFNDMWGNICGDAFNSPIRQMEADVMCHHLGYTGASDYSLASNDE